MIGYAQGSIVNQRVVGARVSGWTKTIPESRDRWQSAVLVWTVGTVLIVASVPIVMLSLHRQLADHWVLRTGIVSLTFAVMVWALRAATPLAAFFGGVICLLVTLQTEQSPRLAESHSGLLPLMALFVLTFLATKAGKIRKARLGVAESRRGRSAAQVIANLGAAALAAILGFFYTSLHQASLIMLLGALAEATADTVSSEIGAAFGGQPFLVTTFRRVEAGIDGAVSVLGTVAGSIASGLIVAVGVWSLGFTLRQGLAAFLGGSVGLFFDSFLGATVERQGWFGNDWVNFLSTMAGGLVAWGLSLA